MAFTYRYPRPAVTVDVVLVAAADDGVRVLLIRRAGAPFEGKLALPGGFLDIDEEIEDAARRELEEETGLRIGAMHELGAYGRLGRDPRGRTVSVVFLAVHPGAPPAAVAGDDASATCWQRLDRLPRRELAFDHADILADARVRFASLWREPDDFAATFFGGRGRGRARRLGIETWVTLHDGLAGEHRTTRGSLRAKLARRGLLRRSRA